MDEIRSDKRLKLQLLVSGMHLSPEFGLTFKEIEKDGFPIDEKVEMLVSSDSAVGLNKSIGLGIAGIGEAYARLKPDIVVINGDRFESFAAATAAMISRIPIAHLHGGESTFGVIDEQMRHAMTKMSHLHFTSSEVYRRRVVQLGEDPGRVFNVGALGLDNIRKLRLLSREELEKELGFAFRKKNLMVTFHPVTLAKDVSGEQFATILGVLNEMKDAGIVFTKANADEGGHLKTTASFVSLGRLRYLSMMQFSDAIVGNSSSGIIEAPHFNIGTINIGDRQDGRLKVKSIIDCDPSAESIRKAFRRLYSKGFKRSLRFVKNPYGDGRAAERITRILRTYDLSNVLKKVFRDMPSAR